MAGVYNIYNYAGGAPSGNQVHSIDILLLVLFGECNGISAILGNVDFAVDLFKNNNNSKLNYLRTYQPV